VQFLLRDVFPVEGRISNHDQSNRLRALMGAPCDTGSTPLHFACNRPSTTRALLENGCPPTPRNHGKSIPLHYAGSREIAELLVQHGGAASVNTVNSLGDTPLHLSISHGLTDVVLVLLRHGARVDLPCRSPSFRGAPMTVELLLTTLEKKITKGYSPKSRQINEMRELRGLREISMLLRDMKSVRSTSSSSSSSSFSSSSSHLSMRSSTSSSSSSSSSSKQKMNVGWTQLRTSFQFRRCCWFGFRTLSKHPKDELERRTKIPSALMEEIVVLYLGPFPGGTESLYIKEWIGRRSSMHSRRRSNIDSGEEEEEEEERRRRRRRGSNCIVQ